MTTQRPPQVRLGTPCCRYSELAIGDELYDALTITETHVVMAAAVFNDPGPNHINALHAAANMFGQRIAHGPLLIGVMDGVLGNVLGSSIIALLEQHAQFRAPVFFGDTVRCGWRVNAMVDKPRFGGGGVVTFVGEAAKQESIVVAEMTSVLAVADEPTGQQERRATVADPR